MLNALKSFFDDVLDKPEQQKIDLELAITVLLYEVAHADADSSDEEDEAITRLIRKAFDLEIAAANNLINKAKQSQADSISVHTFTRVIKDQLTRPERARFVKAMWLVAYSDGQLDKYEEAIIRKVADLLYLDHSEFIKAKLDAISESGL